MKLVEDIKGMVDPLSGSSPGVFWDKRDVPMLGSRALVIDSFLIRADLIHIMASALKCLLQELDVLQNARNLVILFAARYLDFMQFWLENLSFFNRCLPVLTLSQKLFDEVLREGIRLVQHWLHDLRWWYLGYIDLAYFHISLNTRYLLKQSIKLLLMLFRLLFQWIDVRCDFFTELINSVVKLIFGGKLQLDLSLESLDSCVDQLHWVLVHLQLVFS